MNFNMHLPRFGCTQQNVVHNSFFWRVSKYINRLPSSLLAVKNSATFKTKIQNIDLLELLKIDDIID
ncbi:hypothetical protein Y032_0089g2268 [Ancylostoma ceylanicum]|uniref:Uncharacterized protein n=1 Tax=Ancylostoma ceylanicum TaxID=53326 RepID=A0A016TNZ2_9BILA|nr:hypothetical protein Y032_0089g2268 [Ancylostoma ceylanicum]